MKRLFCEKRLETDKQGREYYVWEQKQKPDRNKAEKEARAELYSKYSVDAITKEDLDKCELEELRDMLRYLKRYANDVRGISRKVHEVYDHKVVYQRALDELAALPEEKKAIYKEMLK